MSEIPDSLKPAFALFVQEISTHTSYLQNIVDKYAGSPSLPDDWNKERLVLQNRFHVVKGGAGFFKLHGVIQTAGRGESLFAGITDGSQYLAAVTSDLPNLVGDLKNSAASL